MTSPDGEIPEKAVTQAEISAMQDYTQEGIAADANADMLAVAEEARDNFFNSILGGVLSVPLAIISAINQFISDLVYALKGITGGFIDLTGFFQDVEDNAQTAIDTAVDLENRVTILESGVTLSEFSSNGTWNKPANCRAHRVVLVAGGGGGRRTAGTITATNGAYGAGQGGWAIWDFADADLSSSVSVVIGTGGRGATSNNTNGAGGNNTSFGSYLTAGGGTGGYDGAPYAGIGTNNLASHGGNGRNNGGAGDNPVASNGGNGFLCAGGLASQTAAGGAGNSPPAGKAGPGSGGGGGGRQDTGSATVTKGGDGGFPGGGGAGGGAYGNAGVTGNGGNGGDGKAWIYSYPTAQ